jgi:hypothetical protein
VRRQERDTGRVGCEVEDPRPHPAVEAAGGDDADVGADHRIVIGAVLVDVDEDVVLVDGVVLPPSPGVDGECDELIAGHAHQLARQRLGADGAHVVPRQPVVGVGEAPLIEVCVAGGHAGVPDGH